MAWYNSNWQYRKEITIDSTKVDGDLTDWPLTVLLDSDGDLASNAQSSGDDILFTASDGTTKLSHEIENYDGSTGTLWAHVKIPSLSSSSDTTIYVYYGNSGASNQESVANVWSNGYEAVYHLDEEASGTGNTDVYKDSTANNYHADDYASATGQTGQIHEGQALDGSNDYIDGQTSSDHLFSDVTVTVWANKSDWANNREFIHAVDDDVITDLESPIQIEVRDGGTLRHARGDAAGGIATYDVSGWTGYHQVGWKQNRVDSSTVDVSMMADGGTVATASGDYEDVNLTRNHLGAYLGGDDFYWSGYMDELRVASVTRSNAWVSTSYTNQNDPLSFYSVGTQERAALKIAVTVSDATGASPAPSASGTGSAAVSPGASEATGTSPAPSASATGSAAVSPGASEATGTSPSPAASGSGTVTVSPGVSTATGTTPLPAVTPDMATIAALVSAATGTSPAPTASGTGSITVSPGVSAASGTSPAPTLSATGTATVSAGVSEAIATTPLAVVTPGTATVGVPVSSATGTTPIINLILGRAIYIGSASSATATTPTPSSVAATGTARLSVAASLAEADSPLPVIEQTIGLLSGLNDMDGLDE